MTGIVEWRRRVAGLQAENDALRAQVEAARAVARRALADITDGREQPAGWEEADFTDIAAALTGRGPQP